MYKRLLGIIALLGGIAMAFYGSSLNNSIKAQITSLFYKGAANPGNVWLYAGIAVAVVGAILLILGTSKNNSSN